MTSAERTIALSGYARQIATELNKLNPLRPWTFVEPTEDTYNVYLRNAGKARIYIQYSHYGDTNTRLSINGYMHIGKNGSYVEVHEQSSTGWNKTSAPSITVAIARGCAAIAKDIAKRFLPEYMRVFALAEAKVKASSEYDALITDNLQRLAKVAGVTVPSAQQRYNEVNKSFSFRVGDSRYYSVTTSAKDCSMKLDTLSFEQAEHIIKYLRGHERT